MKERAIIVAGHFMADVTQVTSLGAGRINDTYLVTNGDASIVLRRINSAVFPRPRVVVENFSTLSDHLSSHKQENYFWPQAIFTRKGQLWHEDENGGIWHAQHYLPLTGSAEGMRNSQIIHSCGACLGQFHLQATMGTGLPLHEPLPYFHHLPFYLKNYDSCSQRAVSRKELFCKDYIAQNREEALLLTHLNDSGQLGKTIIHGDPKADNFVFGVNSIGLIDLDTAYFGSVHIDLGDALRSFCNPTGEDEYNPDFDIDVFRSFISGYMTVMGSSLTAPQKEAIYTAVFTLSFELGLRFFADHLAGDSYFKVNMRGDNLRRGVVQFQLCEKITEKREELLKIIKNC